MGFSPMGVTFMCPRCGDLRTMESSRWHWLHRIRRRPCAPLAWFSDRRAFPPNLKPHSPAYPSELYRRHSPKLPTPRPRALTLDSSPYPPKPAETSTSILHTASQSSSPIFSRLPLELRMLIYGELFGNRTLHIVLEYTYPDARGIKHDRSGLATHMDMGRPEQWYWWHCVCHRDPMIPPWLDTCRQGVGTYCDPRGKDRGSCDIDIGWLLTCRQGYSEAISVLYGTNRLHVTEDQIGTFRILRLVLLPQRLATITAVDITWPQVGQRNKTGEHWSPPTGVWDMLSLMTGLRSILLTLLIGTFKENPLPLDASEEKKRDAEREWLGPPDDLVRRLGSQLEEFTFMVSSDFYSALQRLRNEEEMPSDYESLKRFTRVMGDYKYTINEWHNDPSWSF